MSTFQNLERLILVDKGNKDFRQFHLWLKLVSKSWDLTVDMRGSEITTFMMSGRRKIIKGDRTARQYRQLSAALGISPAPLPHIWTNAADYVEAEKLLPSGGPVIGLCPTASEKRKMWPAARYAETFRRWLKSFQAPGPRCLRARRYICAELLVALPGAINLSCNIAIPQLAACATRLALLIGNDTGLPHIAAAAGAPTLSLFTSPRADIFAPAGPRAVSLVATDQPSETPMEALAVETVLAAATKLLQQ